MTDRKKNIVLPPPLRDSLLNEPEGERRHIVQIWDLLDEVGPSDQVEVSTDEAWSDLVGRLEPPNPESRSIIHRNDRRNLYPRMVLVGAAIAAAVVVGFGIWLFVPITVAVEAGEYGEVNLPDGSVVEINSATELRYTRGFDVPGWSRAERRVRLTGEAFFRIEPAGGSFVVETSVARVEALGTSFNVLSRPGTKEGGTQVTLASGRIRLHATSAPDRAVILSDPGAVGIVSDGGRIRASAPESAAPLEHVLAWRERGFAAVDRPLGAILDEVERRYGVTIAPRTGVDLTEPMSLFYLRGGTVDQILRDVCLIQGCTYRETSRGFALSAPEQSL